MTSKAQAPAKSKEQIDIEKRQAEDLKTLKSKEEAGKKARERKKRGRSSLISGGEQGITKKSLG